MMNEMSDEPRGLCGRRGRGSRWLLGRNGRAKAASTADAACVDDNTSVTVYAAINLGGADLVRLLKHQN